LAPRQRTRDKSVYRQYGVLVDDEDAKHAESDWLTIQTRQKHIYLRVSQEKSTIIAGADSQDLYGNKTIVTGKSLCFTAAAAF